MKMQVPEKKQLINNIKNNLPNILLEQPIWLAYYYKQLANGTYTKPPCTQQGHTVDDASLGVTFNEACKDGYPGIKINKFSPLVAFDIDDKEAKLGKKKFSLENLSLQFQDFLMQYDSYTELSPSGCGIRILMNCEDKKELPGKISLIKELCIGGELFINSGYVTITGNQIAGTIIAEIQPKELMNWSTIQKAEIIEMPITPERLPILATALNALKSCKLDQRERIRDAYKTITGEDYNHYDYWIKIMIACHHYATVSGQLDEVVAAIVEWSATDLESFESEEDVLIHWSSLKAEGITYHTLFKFAQLLRFQWPQEAYDKKGTPTGNPMINVVENFEYLMDYFNIQIFQDIFNSNIYLKSDKDTMENYILLHENIKSFFGMAGPFTHDQLKEIMWKLAQNNGYTNVAHSTISPLFNYFFNNTTKEMNSLKLWLKTSPENLPDDFKEPNTNPALSNIDYLLSCITFSPKQDKELVRIYFDTFFYEMMMPIYNIKRQYSQRSFMLVMVGPEACRKTTFFTMLFPSNLRRQFVTNSTETLGGAKSIRDFSTSLVQSSLVVVDEFEIFYNKKNDSLFKTYVTSDVVDYVPIYEKTMRKEFKNAVLAGTTNKRSLPFEQDNNRRLAFANVQFIDTSAMEVINWHHFYRDYIAKGEEAMRNGIQPWKLSQKTIQAQYEANEEFRAQTNLEMIMKEIFDFDMKTHKRSYDFTKIRTVMSDPNLMRQKEIIAIIIQQYPSLNIQLTELKHVLTRLCGRYTRTTNRYKELPNAKGNIENGIVKQGQYIRFIMPPLLSNFEPE